MPADHEATVRAFFGAWVERDPGKLTSFFAPDGTWSEANRDAAKGPDEIRPVFELQTSFGSDFSFEFKRLEVVRRHGLHRAGRQVRDQRHAHGGARGRHLRVR